MNAKNEFLSIVKGREVECATILYHKQGDEMFGIETIRNYYKLIEGYTLEEFEQFVNSLDFEYDSGYGCQELFGMIWFKDGTWADRGEYDGSEWWSLKSRPEIPDVLKRSV